MKKHIEAATSAQARTTMVLIARGIIKHAIYSKNPVFYAHLAWTLGVAPGGSQLAQILGEIAEEDVRQGLPISTSIVISSKTGVPGPGFFTKAAALGLLPANASAKAQDAFWVNEYAKASA